MVDPRRDRAEATVQELGQLYSEAIAILGAIAEVPANSIGEYMRLGQESQRQAREFIAKLKAQYPHLAPEEEG